MFKMGSGSGRTGAGREQASRQRRQQGAVAVLVAGMLVGIIAMVSLVVDAGKAYLTHSRLQLAADACALAGVRQLDKTISGLKRGTDAGVSVARANLERSLSPAEYAAAVINITFNDNLVNGFTTSNAIAKTASFLRCTVQGPNTWLSRLLANTTYTLKAQATAEMQSAAAVCAIPLAVCAKEVASTTTKTPSCTCSNPSATFKQGNTTHTAASCSSTSDKCSNACSNICTSEEGGTSTAYAVDNSDPVNRPFGLYRGQWVSRSTNDEAEGAYTGGPTGSFNWANITGAGGAKSLRDALAGPGYCDIDTTNTSASFEQIGNIGNPGAVNSMKDPWNSRLGLYSGNNCNAQGASFGDEPDYTGYSFDPSVYTADALGIRNVLSRTNCPASTATTSYPCNYGVAKEGKLPYQLPPGNSQCALTSAQHAAQGTNRRLVALPVVQCSKWSGNNPQQTQVMGWMCGLIVRQYPANNGKLEIEVHGAVNEANSPCGQVGVSARNSMGGKVPTLVE